MEAQNREVAYLKQHLDHSQAQLELRIRNEINVAVHAAEQRLSDQLYARFESFQKRQEEQFRWVFGLLVATLLSNGAAILTFTNLLLNR